MAFVGFESLNDEIFQTQLKAKYKSKIFIGNFKEKRLVESLKCYRDAILIETTQEKEFAQDLESFLQEIFKHVRSQIYVGVTKNDDENFTIWTELDEDCNAFGKYWFQIKTIKFRFNEIQIKLKKLRSINDSDTKSFTEKLRAVTNRDPNDSTNSADDAMEQWKALYEFWKKEISAAVAWLLSISINRQTITETLRFVSLLVVSFFAGSTQIVKYLGIFAIKLIERTTWLAHVLTPFGLALLELVSKVIGGFYLLIAMIWRDSVGARRPPPNNAIEAGPRRRPPASIRYNDSF